MLQLQPPWGPPSHVYDPALIVDAQYDPALIVDAQPDNRERGRERERVAIGAREGGRREWDRDRNLVIPGPFFLLSKRKNRC